ncbi:MAG: flagellar hook-associated protein FlgL [Planctomycetota bacterium]
MTIRPTQGRIFDLVRDGIQSNTAKLIRAQEQASSGRRIVRASDDAVGTSVSLSLRRQIGSISAFASSTSSARPEVEQASARLQEGSGVLAEIRSLIIQGMNGALNAQDREAVARQIELLEGQLLDIANTRSGDSYLFAGTATGTQPFVEVGSDGAVEYYGNDEQQRILTGRDAGVVVNVTGREVFARYDFTGTRFSSSTGIRAGRTVDSGTGYEEVLVRQDGTTGAVGAGIAIAGGQDSVVGDRTVEVDAASRTIRLGNGQFTLIPDPAPSSFFVHDEHGGRVAFDFSGWTGGDATGNVTGQASVSLDGINYTSVNFTETDLRLESQTSGANVHVNTTQLVRAGSDLVTLQGTPSLFETIRGAVADLRLGESTDRQVIVRRLEARLGELDRSQNDLLVGLGKLGAASKRLDVAATRLEDLEVTVEGLISNVEDADYAEVALDLQRAEQTLQLAQATGARLMQQSLLRYL